MGWGVWEPLRKKKNSILPLGFLKTSNFNTLALNILRDRRGRILAMMTVPLFTHNFTYLLIIARHNTYLQIPHEAVKGQQWEWANKPKRKNNLIKKNKNYAGWKKYGQKRKNALLRFEPTLLPTTCTWSQLSDHWVNCTVKFIIFNTFLCQRHCLKMVELYLSWMHAKIHFKEN